MGCWDAGWALIKGLGSVEWAGLAWGDVEREVVASPKTSRSSFKGSWFSCCVGR